MPNLNRVMLMGNLTEKPELRYTPSNVTVTNFSIAINSRWKNKAGEQQEETTYVPCEAFSKKAELISQHFNKGYPIYVDGRLRMHTWEKDGKKMSRLVLNVLDFQFIRPREYQNNPGRTQELPY